MLTGRTPTSLNSTFRTMKNALPGSAKTLAEYLREAGYYTMGYASTYCVQSKLGFSQGFDHYDDALSSRPGNNKARASEINARAMDWLQRQYLPKIMEKKPLFLFLYYFDGHVWYDPLPPYDTMYDPEYTGPLTPEVYAWGQDIVEGRLLPAERDIEHLKAMYDGEITYWDSQLGQMLIFLEENHLLDNALIIVTSDHGEMFGEHGKWIHTNSLYEEVLRVPLVMRYIGVIPAGGVVTSPVQNYDLMPTILEWVGLPIPEEVQSTSLQDMSLGASGDEQRYLYSEIDALNDHSHALYWIAPKVSIRSVQEGEWKLIHHLENPANDELYHLASGSIYERENNLTTEPDMYHHLLEMLMGWFALRP
jgi:arylsulfatase A-like enzyme